MRDMGLYRGKPKTTEDYFFFSQNWKDNCEEGFVYGKLIISKGKYYICVSALSKLNCCINNGTVSMIEVIPETVGEYTGLTDKNEKKIWEGDIIKADNWLHQNMKIYTIVFENSGFYAKHKDEDCWNFDHLENIEIIGNIYHKS